MVVEIAGSRNQQAIGATVGTLKMRERKMRDVTASIKLRTSSLSARKMSKILKSRLLVPFKTVESPLAYKSEYSFHSFIQCF